MKTFKIEIGDMFDEGHHIIKNVFIESDTDIAKIREAFIKAAKSMDLFDEKKSIFKVCDEWREYNMSYDIVKILVENGVDLKNVVQDYDLEELDDFSELEKDFYVEFEWNQRQKEKAMAILIMNMAKKELDFDYKIVNSHSDLSFNNSENMKFNVGYGMMD